MTELFLGAFLLHTIPMPSQVAGASLQPNVIMKFEEVNILVGHNSISKPIFGAGYDFKVTEKVNFKLGGYFQNSYEFDRIGVQVPYGDFMPIVGFELNVPIGERVNYTTILTPFVAVTGLTVEF